MSTLPVEPGATRKLSAMERRTEMAWIRSVVSHAAEKVGMSHVRFDIEWNNRFTRRLGDARAFPGVARGRLRFSATALYLRATHEEREQLVYHEAAHVLADLHHQRRCKHGPLWKGMMHRLGRPADRCHSVNRDGLRRRNARQRRQAPRGWARRMVVVPPRRPAPKPAPTPEPAPEVSLLDKLVAFEVEGAEVVGRVVQQDGDRLTVLVVGGHQAARYGRHRKVAACEARPY